MTESKTKNEIALEERIAQIDDINFDKIYDVTEFANKQIENFEGLSMSNSKIVDFDMEKATPKKAFELELQPNEFLDNMVWGQEEESIAPVQKFKIANKPLFITFTSIAVLLCILFIYNVFLIKSLESKIVASSTSNLSISTEVVEENNYILFDNSKTLQIENANFSKSLANSKGETNQKALQTSWFDDVCNFLNQLFGGKY